MFRVENSILVTIEIIHKKEKKNNWCLKLSCFSKFSMALTFSSPNKFALINKKNILSGYFFLYIKFLNQKDIFHEKVSNFLLTFILPRAIS